MPQNPRRRQDKAKDGKPFSVFLSPIALRACALSLPEPLTQTLHLQVAALLLPHPPSPGLCSLPTEAQLSYAVPPGRATLPPGHHSLFSLISIFAVYLIPPLANSFSHKHDHGFSPFILPLSFHLFQELFKIQKKIKNNRTFSNILIPRIDCSEYFSHTLKVFFILIK